MSIFDKVAGIFGASETPDESQDLEKWLEQTLKSELKLDKIKRDDDGDIPVVWGSAVVFVSAIDVDDELPLIRVFAPLLEDFTMSPEVYEAVNTINCQTPFAKAIVDPEIQQILLTADIFVFDQLSPEQLMATIELVGDNADHLDTMLKQRFGGTTMLDDDAADEFDV